VKEVDVLELRKRIEGFKRIEQICKEEIFGTIFAMFVVLHLILIFLLLAMPTFKDVFDSFGASLPPLTRALVDTSERLMFIKRNDYWIVLILAAVVYNLRARRAPTFLRAGLHWLWLKLPLFGPPLCSLEAVRYLYVVQSFGSRGALSDAVALVFGATTGNEYLRWAAKKDTGALRKSLASLGMLPGEQTIEALRDGANAEVVGAVIHQKESLLEDQVDRLHYLRLFFWALLALAFFVFVAAMFFQPVSMLGNVVGK
jgi:type IV pilus assembly protein PilC